MSHLRRAAQDLVLDAAHWTAVAKWEARFEVRQAPEKPWKTVPGTKR
jgi:hypothetical protein